MTITDSPAFQRTRDLVQPGLRAAVTLMDPASAAMASYHFGWTDSAGRAVDADGGKALRPALALLSARAVGADDEVAVPGAVAVELVHNFSLIHDDVMDRDETRRHRPSVWVVWGVPSAILVGDAMLVAAQRTIVESSSAHVPDALGLLLEATQRLIGGQAEDLDFERRRDVSLDDCKAMTAGKTGALLQVSASIGAVLAGAEPAIVAALSRYGSHVGAAFQLVDDLLGIWGDPEVTGKPVLSDLRSGKKSLPIAYSLGQGDRAADELAARLAKASGATEAELSAMADLVESCGGRRWAEQEADRQCALARAAVADLRTDPETRDELVDLADFVVARRF